MLWLIVAYMEYRYKLAYIMHNKYTTMHSASRPYNTTPFAFAKFYISTNCAVSLLCVQDLFKLGKRFTAAVVASMFC